MMFMLLVVILMAVARAGFKDILALKFRKIQERKMPLCAINAL
jgi:hypothetical protein